MKKIYILWWVLLPAMSSPAKAQVKITEHKQVPVKMPAAEKEGQQAISYRFVDNYQVIVELQDNTYDRLLILDMRGSVVLQQAVCVGYSRIDVSNMGEGVYLIVLRSSLSLKEKSGKFVVRK